MDYQVYMVGGAVRDELLGRAVKDRDWVIVGATPDLLLSEGYLQVGKDFPVFLHPKTKEEYALARTERKQGHGYSGFEVFATPDVSLEEDLLRRDLTINAIAKDAKGQLYDPYYGQKDIDDRLLRHVSPAFEEDPLRVLRLARFFARFYEEGFQVADETKSIVQRMVDSGEVDHLVPERIWLETHKALSEKHPEQYFIALKDLNALAAIFPSIAYCFDNKREKLQIAFDCITEASIQSLSMHIRVALLMTMFESVADVKQFAKDYRLSVLEKVTAEKLCAWKSWFNAKHDTAEPWLELLMGLDAFRKPDQMEDFLSCMEILMKINGDVAGFLEMKNQLLKVFNELSCIDIKSIIINVLPKEIPVKIKEYRLEVIKKMLKF